MQKSSQYGIVDINGKQILPVQYSEIEVRGIYLQTIQNEEKTYFDLQGNKIDNLNYTSMLKTDNENYYITINEDGYYGIVNSQKKELVKNKYNYLEYLFGEYFIAANEEGNLGIINTKDETKVEFIYEVLQKIDDTSVVEAKILKENRSDLYAQNLEKIYSVNYATIYKENNSLKVSSKEDVKYFDVNGKELTVNDIYPNNTLFTSKKDGKWGYINEQGNVVIDYQYDSVTEFNSYGFAGIKKDDLWGVINKNGEIIVEPKYKIPESNLEPEFLGKYYKVYYGYGESYYTSN